MKLIAAITSLVLSRLSWLLLEVIAVLRLSTERRGQIIGCLERR